MSHPHHGVVSATLVVFVFVLRPPLTPGRRTLGKPFSSLRPVCCLHRERLRESLWVKVAVCRKVKTTILDQCTSACLRPFFACTRDPRSVGQSVKCLIMKVPSQQAKTAGKIGRRRFIKVTSIRQSDGLSRKHKNHL